MTCFKANESNSNCCYVTFRYEADDDAEEEQVEIPLQGKDAPKLLRRSFAE